MVLLSCRPWLDEPRCDPVHKFKGMGIIHPKVRVLGGVDDRVLGTAGELLRESREGEVRGLLVVIS